MRAHFVNVGQAHATLLEFPCGTLLIDSGAQDATFVEYLVEYVGEVFAARPDLEPSIDVAITTHIHPDHTMGLREVAESFPIRTYIDNGHVQGSGSPAKTDPRWIRSQPNTQVRVITDGEFDGDGARDGLTDGVIDPLTCGPAGPTIRILTGPTDTAPEWSVKEFKNENNHSLVVRVDFGESSFLFTGDLELAGIERMLAHYEGTDALDVDVYQVGHHGSYNATTEELLAAMTPRMAVVPVGHWSFGSPSTDGYTTFAYGHPRRLTIDRLEATLTGSRPKPRLVMVADGQGDFHRKRIKKAIYATAWDGDVVVLADSGGNIEVIEQ